jgi:hypothetical protein
LLSGVWRRAGALVGISDGAREFQKRGRGLGIIQGLSAERREPSRSSRGSRAAIGYACDGWEPLLLPLAGEGLLGLRMTCCSEVVEWFGGRFG